MRPIAIFKVLKRNLMPKETFNTALLNISFLIPGPGRYGFSTHDSKSYFRVQISSYSQNVTWPFVVSGNNGVETPIRKMRKIDLAKNELVNQNHLGWLADWQYTYSCRQSQPAQMRVLLRNTKTGFYFQSPEAWTSDDTNALDFHHSA